LLTDVDVSRLDAETALSKDDQIPLDVLLESEEAERYS